jgi:ketosteroid isomerase-like protein
MENPAALQTELVALTLRFFDALDRRDNAACAAALAPDGVWERQGVALRGRPAVLEALAARSPERRTCHICTNLVATLTEPGKARVDFILTAYEGHEVADGSPPVAKLAGIRRCVDDMTLTAEGWRIAHKRSTGMFKGA